MQKWKLLNTKNVLKNEWSQVDLLDFEIRGQKFTDYLKVTKSDFVIMLGLTEKNEVVLVKEYVWGGDFISTSLPAGRIEEGEDPKEAALREFIEETGYTADSCEIWGTFYPDPKPLTYKGYICFLSNCKKQSEQDLDEGEDIEVILKDIENLKKEILNGTINDAKIMSVISLYLLKKQND